MVHIVFSLCIFYLELSFLDLDCRSVSPWCLLPITDQFNLNRRSDINYLWNFRVVLEFPFMSFFLNNCMNFWSYRQIKTYTEII